MISISPIWAITLRHFRLYKHDPNIALIMIYWPLLDIITWGFLGAWIQQSGVVQFHNYEIIALLGVLLWQVAARGANAISIALCEELWQHNVINLFSLPLSILNWISGVILYFTLMLIAIAFCSILCIYAFYDIALLSLVSNFLLFFTPLFFCGIWLGFICLQIIIVLGKRGTELGFVLIWFLLPFSGAYYPVDILPTWAQTVSACFPMSYAFTGMREHLIHNHNPMPYLIKSTILSVLYATSAIIIFVYLFNYSKQKGLARLTD